MPHWAAIQGRECWRKSARLATGFAGAAPCFSSAVPRPQSTATQCAIESRCHGGFGNWGFFTLVNIRSLKHRADNSPLDGVSQEEPNQTVHRAKVMGWGNSWLRGQVPNTSRTCCAFRRPHFSTALAAPRPITVCSASLAPGEGEGRGEGATYASKDALPRDLPLSLRLTPLSDDLEPLSGHLDRLSPGLSTLTGNIGTLSDATGSKSNPIHALSILINPLSDDIFSLSGDIFVLSEGISPQFQRNKPLTHSKLAPKHHPGPCSSHPKPSIHPSYA